MKYTILQVNEDEIEMLKTGLEYAVGECALTDSEIKVIYEKLEKALLEARP